MLAGPDGLRHRLRPLYGTFIHGFTEKKLAGPYGSYDKDKYVTFSVLEFHFTTLKATGKEGPTSNTGYKGSSLENVNVTNGLQEWRAPLTGWNYFHMCGASGGDVTEREKKGGKGARVNGTVHLEEGTELVVLVGQKGFKNFYSVASGGGSIAGGGAGASYSNHGGPGQAGEAEGLKNGTVGQGGLTCVGGNYDPTWNVGPGGGFRGDGKCCVIESCRGTEGKSFLNRGSEGTGATYFDHKFMDGGFGGGGSDGGSQRGGGGEYSGGSVIGYQFPPFVSGGSGSYTPRDRGM